MSSKDTGAYEAFIQIPVSEFRKKLEHHVLLDGGKPVQCRKVVDAFIKIFHKGPEKRELVNLHSVVNNVFHRFANMRIVHEFEIGEVVAPYGEESGKVEQLNFKYGSVKINGKWHHAYSLFQTMTKDLTE